MPASATEADFAAWMGMVQARVEAALARNLPAAQHAPARLHEAMRYAAIGGGKRVRPLLVAATADLFGVDRHAAVRAGCAVEAIHVYSLIHDDLPAMDDDDLRRGRPTCHKKFDEATAILVGDALQARAFEVLASQITPPECAARCCAELAQAVGASGLVVALSLFSATTALGSAAKIESSTTSTASTTPASAYYETITVLPGESLWSIAGQVDSRANRGDLVAAIIDLNGLSGSALQAGQRLRVPVASK